MKHTTLTTALLALSLTFAGSLAAQQTNEQARQDAAAQANMDQHASKQEKKAAKAQEKADHKREKALKTDEAKDAVSSGRTPADAAANPDD